MSRSTIDFGIDLGTTNSAIAVLHGVDAQVVKNKDDQDVTPSAVWINKQGITEVGARAKSATIQEKNQRDAYLEFKRQMGTPFQYEFSSSGQRRKPEELSAEVLKELKKAVQSKTGEIIQSSVITVPAAFELHQCDATRRAAELAGFSSSPLVQEPVAAALAYGFQIDAEKAYWMVYDFGGGTFDAALIKAEEGMINVVHHRGDNFLGGSDIDWAIVEQLIIPRLTQSFNLPGCGRSSARWGLQVQRIKHDVEAVKIKLSTDTRANLMGGVSFEDDSGNTVDCDELILTREELVRVAEPIIARSIEICRRVLQERNLGAQAIQRVIIVGGPTKAPYFREMLSEGLGIPIDYSRDPMTVVAQGAAVFAGTQKIDAKLQKKAIAGEFQVAISDKYKPVGHDSEPLIAGKVTSPDGAPATELSVEFVNRDSKWRSGQIPLNAAGSFMANLHAERGVRNTFHIELTDRLGALQKAVPDHVVYTVGAVIEEQPLLKSIGLAKADNSVDWFFKAGCGLPQKKKGDRIYKTTVPVRPGQPSDALKIPIVEGGENPCADRNRCVGTFTLESSKIRRDLPAGQDVEITLTVTESRTIKAEVYIPLLDETFDWQLPVEKQGADPAKVSETFSREADRLNELREKAANAADQEVERELDELDADDQVGDAVRAAKGDPEKAQARLLEFQQKLDAAEEKLKWPALVTEVNDLRDELRNLANRHGTDAHMEKVEDWSDAVDSVISRQQRDRLSRKLDEGRFLYAQILFSIPAFWVGEFQRLERDVGRFSDNASAERLIERGRSYLLQNNIEGLTDVVRRLWNMLPHEEAERRERGIGSTIM